MKNAKVREVAERFIEEVAPCITAETLNEEFALPKEDKQHFVGEFAKFEPPVKARFKAAYRRKVDELAKEASFNERVAVMTKCFQPAVASVVYIPPVE